MVACEDCFWHTRGQEYLKYHSAWEVGRSSPSTFFLVWGLCGQEAPLAFMALLTASNQCCLLQRVVGPNFSMQSLLCWFILCASSILGRGNYFALGPHFTIKFMVFGKDKSKSLWSSGESGVHFLKHQNLCRIEVNATLQSVTPDDCGAAIRRKRRKGVRVQDAECWF